MVNRHPEPGRQPDGDLQIFPLVPPVPTRLAGGEKTAMSWLGYSN